MPNVAIVLCPGDNAEAVARRLLGLTVGERLLLALYTAGVRHVVFAGPGSRPSCARLTGSRAAMAPEVIAPEALERASGAWVLVSDVVFARSLLGSSPPRATDDLPVRHVAAEHIDDVLAAPEAWIERLGVGDARSGQDFAIRVTDDRAAGAARRALLLSLRKPIDGMVSRHLNRYISTFLSSLLVRTNVAPNALTVLFLFIGLAAGVFAGFAEFPWCLVVAGVLFQSQSVLDGCDGEIARLSYRFSRSGQWLDSIGDDLTNYAFCFGLAVGQARVLDMPEMYALGGLTLAVQLAASAILYRRMIAMGTGDLLAIPDAVTGGESSFGRVLALLRVLAKRDTFVFIIALVTALGAPLVAFALFAAGSFPMFFGVALNEQRLRRMERAGDSAGDSAGDDSVADDSAGG